MKPITFKEKIKDMWNHVPTQKEESYSNLILLLSHAEAWANREDSTFELDALEMLIKGIQTRKDQLIMQSEYEQNKKRSSI